MALLLLSAGEEDYAPNWALPGRDFRGFVSDCDSVTEADRSDVGTRVYISS